MPTRSPRCVATDGCCRRFRFWPSLCRRRRPLSCERINPIVIGRAAELECLHSGGILRSPMLPDVTKLSEDELIELNRRIVERLQLLRSARSLAQLARFSVGMVVEFDTDDGRTVTGTIARLNQRTATVVTASGRGPAQGSCAPRKHRTPTHNLRASSRCHVARTSARTEAVRRFLDAGFWVAT